MLLPVEYQVSVAAAAGVFCLAMLAEKLHERRVRAVAHLATGPTGRPRRWVRAVPAARSSALAAMAWALVILYYAAGGAYLEQNDASSDDAARRVVFVADLSPSMQLGDAGPGGKLSRSERMGEVVDAVLRRIDGDVRYSVFGFYTTAMPVILDAQDSELVRNVFLGLPVWYVMEPGKTDLGGGIRTALEGIRGYPDDSTTLFVCTDGDTLPIGSIPKPPAPLRQVFVLGAGDPGQGTFIDGHMSRQDAAVLGAVAGRLGGEYLDVNEKHVPTLTLGPLALGAGASEARFGLVDAAIFAFAAGAAVLALLPVLLEYCGSDWRAVRVDRSAAGWRASP